MWASTISGMAPSESVLRRQASNLLPLHYPLEDNPYSPLVLCFDEFQVTDIVNAMILKRLLESLLSYGVVLVITSKESFLGCIELIKNQMQVIDLNSGHDYQSENQQHEPQQPPSSIKVSLSPIDAENQQEFKSRFDKMTQKLAADDPVIENRKLSIWGTGSILFLFPLVASLGLILIISAILRHSVLPTISKSSINSKLSSSTMFPDDLSINMTFFSPSSHPHSPFMP